jgi:circadian clock protein KaiC
MTEEVPDLFGLSRLSEYGISRLSDNVILLQFLRGNSQLKRALTILKSRGSVHEPRSCDSRQQSRRRASIGRGWSGS